MAPPHWLWIVFTLVAVVGQTFRNAVQRKLTQRVGTLGATGVRFVFGLPFALAFLVAVLALAGPLPALHIAYLGWVAAGAVTQILATGFLLSAMRRRSFVVAVAYSKTEPIQVALFGLAVLGDPLTVGVVVAAVAASVGVMTLSWPAAGAPRQSVGPVAQGLVSAAFFAMSSVGFRGAIEALGHVSFMVGATTTLAAGLVLQTAIMVAFAAWHEPDTLRKVAAAWRPALLAGILSALASQFWFFAFALESVARVRTLGVVEILTAELVSRQLFRERLTWRGQIGLALVAVSVVAVIGG